MRRIRTGILTLVFLLSLPTAYGFVTYQPANQRVENVSDNVSQNLTFFTAQGTETGFGSDAYLITENGSVVWTSDRYRGVYDIDPISNDTVLLNGRIKTDQIDWETSLPEWEWWALRINWKDQQVVEAVPIMWNVHDVDYLGNHQYLVAEKSYQIPRKRDNYFEWIEINKRRDWIADSRNHTHSRIYIYDASNDSMIWEYQFTNYYPQSGGGKYYQDWTHLNDVDVYANGSKILASPRNFDQVILIDRASKEVDWRLGRDEEYSILHEQHNPVLLDRSPPTVLVADSENDRVVEYRKTKSGWERTWQYQDDLNWPRDADRLPNGNTLIVDSDGNRLLEVTPSKEVVWQIQIRKEGFGQKPYDIERLKYGDEPQGPPIHEISSNHQIDHAGSTAGPSVFEEYYTLGAWVLPPWVGRLEFILLNLQIFVILGWTGFEIYNWSLLR